MTIRVGTPVWTAGTFDLFHAGHVRFLRRCARLGPVTVALNTDLFIERYKRRRPVIAFEQRREVLEACQYVSQVVVQDSESLAKALIVAKPTWLAIGSDWACKDYEAQIGCTVRWLDDHGISLVYLPYTEEISSSLVRQRLELGYA